MSLVLLRARVVRTEQAPFVFTEDPLCLLVWPTYIFPRAEELLETGFSGKENQSLYTNICFKIFLQCCSLAFRAASKKRNVLPAEVETGPAEAVPTVYGDRIYEVVPADGTGEVLLEDLQDTGVHISEEELATGHFWAWVGR